MSIVPMIVTETSQLHFIFIIENFKQNSKYRIKLYEVPYDTVIKEHEQGF